MNAVPDFFGATATVPYGGPEAKSPLAFRWYDRDRIVRGRRLEDHLRFAVCYWHSFCWPGGDPFGGETFLRPWHHGHDPMALARAKADIAFELFRLLDVPFFTFHDMDAAPEGRSLSESVANLNAIADLFEQKMASAKVRLLWGTANLFTHRRYMAGAATNPDPEVVVYAAAQVRAGQSPRISASLDANRGDDLRGWDTDQFAMNGPELALVFHEMLKSGGFTTGGLNFDAKIRRQSIDPDDLIHAHVGSMDACARAFLAAADMLDAEALTKPVAERYAGWAG